MSASSELHELMKICLADLESAAGAIASVKDSFELVVGNRHALQPLFSYF
jgi:hypothetical protein